MENPSEFADYIVYLGENGPSFKASPTETPAYALTFCIFGKKRFAEETATALQCLKFDYFGHDQVIFDHRDVLKREGDFRDVPESSRKGFLDAMVGILERSDMSVIEVVVRKDRLSREGEASKDVRAFAMREGLRRLYAFTRAKGQADRTWHVICESHGTAEDKRFLAAAQGVCDGENADGCRYPFELTMCPKTFNSAGLQYADLTAHSIGFEVLEPEAKSRSGSILRRKLWRDGAESGEEMPQEVIALPN